MKRSATVNYTNFHITAKVLSHQIKKSSNVMSSAFAVYNISFFTYYKTWVINKRYTDFEDLNALLFLKIKFLPKLPPKRLFSISKETIKERKEIFEDYLNTLFKTINICNFEHILNFIELDKELYSLLCKNGTMIESLTPNSFNKSLSLKRTFEDSPNRKSKSVEISNIDDNYYHTFVDFKLSETSLTNKTINMMVIEEFLINLEQKLDNKIKFVKTFERYLQS